MTKFIHSLRGGQITIPAKLRKQLGITKDTLLQLSVIQGELRMKPVRVADEARSTWMEDLYNMFAPVREEIHKQKYTKEEIDTAINQAIIALRKKHAHRS